MVFGFESLNWDVLRRTSKEANRKFSSRRRGQNKEELSTLQGDISLVELLNADPIPSAHQLTPPVHEEKLWSEIHQLLAPPGGDFEGPPQPQENMMLHLMSTSTRHVSTNQNEATSAEPFFSLKRFPCLKPGHHHKQAASSSSSHNSSDNSSATATATMMLRKPQHLPALLTLSQEQESHDLKRSSSPSLREHQARPKRSRAIAIVPPSQGGFKSEVSNYHHFDDEDGRDQEDEDVRDQELYDYATWRMYHRIVEHRSKQVAQHFRHAAAGTMIPHSSSSKSSLPPSSRVPSYHQIRSDASIHPQATQEYDMDEEIFELEL